MNTFTSYECGLDPYNNISYSYDIRFYLIALLFLLFDVELVYILPIIYSLNIYTYTYTFIFVLLLILGLYYEYNNNT